MKGNGEGFVYPLVTGVRGQGLFYLLRKSFKCYTDRFSKGSTLYLESVCKTGCRSERGDTLDFLYTG